MAIFQEATFDLKFPKTSRTDIFDFFESVWLLVDSFLTFDFKKNTFACRPTRPCCAGALLKPLKLQKEKSNLRKLSWVIFLK